MAETPKIPEQFYKSRLACFTFSTLAFAASIVSDKNLDEMSIFGVRGSSIDHKFLVFALFIAAAVSFASVVLLYIDDVQKFMRFSVGPVPSRTIEEIAGDAREVLDQVSWQTSQIGKDIREADFAGMVSRGPTTLKNEEAERIIDTLWQRKEIDAILASIDSLVSSSLTLSAAREAVESESDKSEVTVFRQDILYSVETLKRDMNLSKEKTLLSFEDPKLRLCWDGPALEGFQGLIETYTAANKRGLQRLVAELEGYNRVIRRANRARRFEYALIGVGAPGTLFFIAAVHCWGRLFGGHFPDLPTWTNRYLF